MKRRNGEHSTEEHGAGMERWLLTYSDMITLLLALFIVLFSMSTISLRKFIEFRTGLATGSPSVVRGGQGLLHQTSLVMHAGQVQSPRIEPANLANTTQMAALGERISALLEAAGLQADTAVAVTQQGVIVRILSDRAYFATDSAALGPIGDRVADVLAEVLRNIPNQVSIEGFTDSRPIVGGPYANNFQLSAARAISLLDRLVYVDHVPPDHVSATGYGPEYPLAPNNSPQHMAENRRVEVVILSTTYNPNEPYTTP
jgi:chemotaxis protein MotB